MCSARLRHVKIKNPRLSPAAGFRNLDSNHERIRLRNKIVQISEEVSWGVKTNKPVIALETTIYTHGFPYPDNVGLASHLESVVRMNGGIPATIGVLNGIARVGLDPQELIELASAGGKKETMKISRRDLPYITGLGLTGRKIIGGTTIAGTMFLAHLAGIKIFGTGGLGGVHRGGEYTMDISADLTELGRTPVAVISSGCKSFLDIPRTLEYLETQGVSVSTFADGRTGNIDLPAFWTRESGVRSPFVVQDEKEAAAMINARWMLGMTSGLFFANPIPPEHSLPKSDIDRAIEEAVQDAERQGVHGHANTPFILDRIKQLTGGKSIPANRALIESNVSRATKVAVEYSKMIAANRDDMVVPKEIIYSPPMANRTDRSANMPGPYKSPVISRIEPSFAVAPKPEVDILVAGSVAVDVSCDHMPSDTKKSLSVIACTSNPAVITQTIGGVGHNVATAAHLIGKDTTVRLCSIVATDLAGMTILSYLKKKGLDVSSVMTLDHNGQAHPKTSQYVAINDANKDLLVAAADMRIISSPITSFAPWTMTIRASKPKWVVVDANWNESAIFRWTKESKEVGASVAIEPVSVEKSKKLFPPKTVGDAYEKKGVYPKHDVDLATPNEQELDAIYTAARECNYLERRDWWEIIDALSIPSTGIDVQLRYLTSPDLVDKGIPQRMIQLLPFMPNIITKLGASGVIMVRLLPPDHLLLQSPESAQYILARNMSGNPDVGGVYLRHFPAAETVRKEDIVSVNGVGDTFLGVLVAGLAKGLQLDEKLIHVAQKASVMTLKSKEAVSPDVASLSAELKA